MWLFLTCFLPLALAGRLPRAVVESTFQVRLNHFDASQTESFPMRYIYDSSFVNGSNLVVVVGGQHALQESAPFAEDLAQMAGAGLFHTEHRFYGESKPLGFSETDASSLRFLSVDQALIDLAQFVSYVRSDDFEDGRFKSGNVSLVGCGYAGSLATWMRSGYPHAVQTVVADSSTLSAGLQGYLDSLSATLRRAGGEECLEAFQSATRGVSSLPASTVGTLFNTCAVVQSTTPLDLATLMREVMLRFEAVLMQTEDVTEMCNALTAEGGDSTTARLAALIRGEECIEASYQQVVATLGNTSSTATVFDERLRLYQSCVQLGWFVSTGEDFGDALPEDFYDQLCGDVFQDAFDAGRLQQSADRTGALFAGPAQRPDRALEALNARDPRATAARARPQAPVTGYEGSRCAVLGPQELSAEPPQATRREVLSAAYEFLTGEEAPAESSSGALSASAVVVAAIALGVLRFY